MFTELAVTSEKASSALNLQYTVNKETINNSFVYAKSQRDFTNRYVHISGLKQPLFPGCVFIFRSKRTKLHAKLITLKF